MTMSSLWASCVDCDILFAIWYFNKKKENLVFEMQFSLQNYVFLNIELDPIKNWNDNFQTKLKIATTTFRNSQNGNVYWI